MSKKTVRRDTSNKTLVPSRSITEMAQDFQDNSKDLKIQELEKKIMQLQEVIRSLLPSDVERLDQSPAEMACDYTIDRLTDRASQTELSLEDMKKLDLAVKNKMTLKQERLSQKPKQVNLPKGLSKADLLKLATSSHDNTIITQTEESNE